MTGIHYVTDDEGRRIAVQIDLERHGELWEDIEDVLIAKEREGEETVPYEQYRQERLERGRAKSG